MKLRKKIKKQKAEANIMPNIFIFNFQLWSWITLELQSHKIFVIMQENIGHI